MRAAKAKRKKVAAGLQGGMSYQTSMDVEQVRSSWSVETLNNAELVTNLAPISQVRTLTHVIIHSWFCILHTRYTRS